MLKETPIDLAADAIFIADLNGYFTELTLLDYQGTRILGSQARRNKSRIAAYSSLPFIAQGKLFGTLSFSSRTRMTFSPTQTQLFQALCDRIATKCRSRTSARRRRASLYCQTRCDTSNNHNCRSICALVNF
ncbi:GAF domain-containing protein [Floridanema aerugineum]|jgi:GAF domain-containing protein|uniref:GAF domain-containing protein n=1 Tax=Floridaenema aerugineum BLCC-F46 TaxID=3153654 RepID=A0ABV4WZZ8_9CYAN